MEDRAQMSSPGYAHRDPDRGPPVRELTCSKAEVEIPQSGAEGMLITRGGRFGGYGFYLLRASRCSPGTWWAKRVEWQGSEVLSPGKHTLEFDFKYDGLGAGTQMFGRYSGLGQGGPGGPKVRGAEGAAAKRDN